MSELTEPTIKAPYALVTQEYLEEISKLGDAIYEKLKPLLEPEHDRQFVTIHVDTEDYSIGKNSSAANRAILERHPIDGRLYTRKIGNEPEYGLAARILASRMKEAQTK